MSSETEELIRICESLPAGKRAEVADFARFLLDRQEDEKWEREIAEPADDFRHITGLRLVNPFDTP